MTTETTIVVEFGTGADSSALVVIELDDQVNIGADGKTKTSFVPGDEPGFIVHFDPAALRIESVKSSSGMVVDQGNVSRARTKSMQFSATDPQTMTHIPAGSVNGTWYGNDPVISVDGRQITPTGIIPAIGEIAYTIAARAYKLIPPPLELGQDDTWPVLVVVTMGVIT